MLLTDADKIAGAIDESLFQLQEGELRIEIPCDMKSHKKQIERQIRDLLDVPKGFRVVMSWFFGIKESYLITTLSKTWRNSLKKYPQLMLDGKTVKIVVRK